MLRALGFSIACALLFSCSRNADKASPEVDRSGTAVKRAPAEIADAAAVEPASYATAAEAIDAIIARDAPTVIGFGEFHEKRGTTIRSALARFHSDIMPALASRTVALVVEVWARDACGAKSEAITRDVAKMTQRPASTESEIVQLLRATKQAGIWNSVLRLSCSDYDAILVSRATDGGESKREVDYEKLLVVLTNKLLERASYVVAERAKKSAPVANKLLLIYGGALHNNLFPYESTRDLTYAPRLQERAGGRFVEIDLYVPEFIDGDELLSKERWYSSFRQRAATDKVFVFERGPRSYIVVLRRGVKKAPPRTSGNNKP